MWSSGVFCVMLVCLTHESFAQTPSKPQLSSFTAEFSVLQAGVQIDNVKYYVNVEEKKQLQILRLGKRADFTVETFEIAVKNNMTQEYDVSKPFDICTGIKSPSDPGDVNIWYWLHKAKFTGTIMFDGNQVDTWSYENDEEEEFFQVGVLPSNPNKPVYYFSTSALGIILFQEYDSTPPASSVFDVPASCKSAPSAIPYHPLLQEYF